MGSIAIFAVCGLVFGSLTICDESDSLALPFAPLPVRRKAIRYADDGRGIPCVPGRGLDLQPLGLRLCAADAGPEDHPRGDRRRGRVGEVPEREDRAVEPTVTSCAA